MTGTPRQDPETASVASGSRPSRARSPWRLVVPVVLVVAGALFTTSATTARGTDLRSAETTRLVDLIGAAEQGNEALRARTRQMQDDVEALTVRSADPAADRVRRQARGLAPMAGLTEVRGPGVTVVLDDAPAEALERDYPGLPAPSPDDLVVHQQDLQAVVNAMWAAGASGIQLMDQRIVSTSAVRCVGNVLILQDRVYSPPYAVTAVGDPDRIKDALDGSSAVSNYLDYVDAYGLGWGVDTHAQIAIPAYAGSLELRYAEVGST